MNLLMKTYPNEGAWSLLHYKKEGKMIFAFERIFSISNKLSMATSMPGINIKSIIRAMLILFFIKHLHYFACSVWRVFIQIFLYICMWSFWNLVNDKLILDKIKLYLPNKIFNKFIKLYLLYNIKLNELLYL